jgi:hypothetical protein
MGDRVGSRHRVLAALGVVGALALTGCNAGNKPAPSGTSSTSSSTTAGSTSSTSPRSSTTTTTAPSPSLPPEATKRTQEGAEHFSRFYFESVGNAYVTGDTSHIEALTDASCAGCRALANAVKKRKAKGQRTDKSSIAVKSVHSESGSGDHYVVNVAGQEVPVRVLDAQGRVVETSKAGVFTASTDVVWRDGTWHVTKFVAL